MPTAPSPRRPHHHSFFRVSLGSSLAGWALMVGLVAGSVSSAARAGDFSTSSGVTVDSSVLDAMGPPMTLPDLMLRPEARPQGAYIGSANAAPGHVERQAVLPDPKTPPQSRLMVPAPMAGATAPSRAPHVSIVAPAPTAPAFRAPAQPTLQSPSYQAPSYTPPSTASPQPPSAAQPPSVVQPSIPAQAPTIAQAPHVTAPVPAAPKVSPSVPAAPTPTSMPEVAPTVAAVPQPPPAAPPEAPQPVRQATQPTTTGAQQTAALPPPVVRESGISLLFGENDTAVPANATGTLDGVAERLGANPAMSVRLEAYASGGSAGKSRARRLSLSRALTVRSYLLDKGIDASRVEVRALGTPDGGNTDRVDISWVSG